MASHSPSTSRRLDSLNTNISCVREIKPAAPIRKPSLISDYEAYNTDNFHRVGPIALGENWVGDLMVECTVEVLKGDGSIVVELAKGHKVYRAEIDIKEQRAKLLEGSKENRNCLCFCFRRQQKKYFASLISTIVFSCGLMEASSSRTPSMSRPPRAKSVARSWRT